MAMMGHGMGADWGDEKKGIDWQILRRMVTFFTPLWRLTAIMTGFVLVGAGLGLLPPIITIWVIDNAIGQGDMTLLLWLVAAMVIVPIVIGLTTVAQGYYNILMVQRVVFEMRNRLYAHLLELPLSFYTKTRAGEIVSRATNDVNGIQTVLTMNFTNLMVNLATLFTTIIVMFILDWGLTLLCLAALPLFIPPTRKVADLRVDIGRTVQRGLAEITAILTEKLSIGGLILVKSFGRRNSEIEHFEARNRRLMGRMIAEGMVTRWLFMFTALFAAVVPALIFGYGGWKVMQGELTIGVLIAFVALVARLFMPVTQLLNVQVDIAGSIALFERIFEYLDLPREIENRPGAIDLDDVAGRIVFDRVDFAYDEDAKTLEQLSFTAEPGEVVAIVGPSGAGKTSIAYLLLRLYEPQVGRITIDGHDLRDVTLESIGRHIGFVSQETNLFHTSLAENLRYAKEDATDEELMAALDAANIGQVVQAMPRGLETRVGERGYRLSGGEKQRVAIARLILKNPEVLILDEATSALDTQSERSIQDALDALMEGRTSFVIAHRLSTILKADKILVIDNGRLVDAGTHGELLARGGLYKRLYEIQFEDRNGAVAGEDVTEAAVAGPDHSSPPGGVHGGVPAGDHHPSG